jgi:hypothetical protein
MAAAGRFLKALYKDFGQPLVDEVMSVLGRDAEPEVIARAVAQRAAQKPAEKVAPKPPAKVPAMAVKPQTLPAPEAPLAVKPRGITAYHGSPHSFDRFDMSKIGTGEGAQAYGHGLYFAENEDVAQTYRDALTKGAMNSTELKKIGLSPNDRAHAMTFARTTNNLFPEVAARDFANYSGKELTPDLIEAFRKTMDVPKGSMYQVRIDADPADFLDYDAPLIGQPQRVREGVARAMSRGDDLLSDLFGDLSDPNAMQIAGLFPKSKGAQAYNTLKYNTKPTGLDDQNNALFDGMAALDGRNPQAATDALREAGIPGIKYLDQGSRTAGDGSRNYVVFDDKLISILKKYGWAPGMAIPAAAMAEYEAEQELARGGFAVKKGR